MMWVLKHVYILRQARNVLRYYLPRLSPPSLGAWLLSEIRDIFGPSLQLTLCSTSTFIWLQSRLDILLESVAQKNALLRSDCFNETLPLIFWDGIAWLVGVNAHIYLRGHSTTTWTEFCQFPTPPPPCVDSFYTISVDKNIHFLTPLPILSPKLLNGPLE